MTSASDWMPAVPHHWTVASLGFRYEVQLGKMLNPDAAGGDYLAPYLRNTDVQWGRINTDDLPSMSFDSRERVKFALRPGDLLVCEGGEVGRAAIWTGELTECFYQKALHRVRPWRAGEEPRFLYYVLAAASWRGAFLAEGNRSTIVHLTAEKLRAMRFPFPPRGEQLAIADFLDRKTATIDTVIEKTERLTELLAEKRLAIISLCASGDTTGPRRESGVEWLGRIPAHWRTVRLSYVARVTNGSTPSRDREDYWADGTVPWLSSGKVNEFVVSEADEFITEEARRACHLSLLSAGTVLVGMVGQGKTRGMSALMALDACINQNVAGVTPARELDPKYLHFVLVHAYEPLRELGQGGQQDALNCATIKAFKIPLPPLPEQQRLVREVEHGLAAVDAAVGALSRRVTTLREYRQTLITAAVTGQLDIAAQEAA